jgi:hypothetical protein
MTEAKSFLFLPAGAGSHVKVIAGKQFKSLLTHGVLSLLITLMAILSLTKERASDG